MKEFNREEALEKKAEIEHHLFVEDVNQMKIVEVSEEEFDNTPSSTAHYIEPHFMVLDDILAEKNSEFIKIANNSPEQSRRVADD